MDEQEPGKDPSAPGEQPSAEPNPNPEPNPTPNPNPNPNRRYFKRSDGKAKKHKSKVTISDGELFVPSITTEELRKRHGGMVARAYFGQDVPAGLLACIWTSPLDDEGYPITLSRTGKSFKLDLSDVLPDYDFAIPAGRKAKVSATIDEWEGHKASLILNLTEPDFIAKRPPSEKKGKQEPPQA